MRPVTPDGIARLVRPVDSRLVAGVAAGVAAHLKVSVGVVRGVFVALALLAGAGIIGYALLWIFAPQVEEPGETGQEAEQRIATQRRQAIGIAALGVAAALVTWLLGVGQWIGAAAGPIVVVAIGTAFIWSAADDTRRGRLRRAAVGLTRPGSGSWWRIAGGIALVVGGLIVFAIAQLDVATARSAAIAVVLTLVGVAVMAVPWLARLVRDLSEERRQRALERDRAEIAAHLHDSVLQTLALIQRRPDDAREVQRLARRQERELRDWLYGPAGFASSRAVAGRTGSMTAGGETGGPHGASAERHADTVRPGDAVRSGDGVTAAEGGSFAVALARAAGEVEDSYAITAPPVVVGDVPLTPGMVAMVAAAREAMVNAAKHSGERSVSLYAEVGDGAVTTYVRDRGRGFDPRGVDADRRGVTESISGRMSRYGGTAQIRSAPGQGCEVLLTMPLRAAAPPPPGAADRVASSAAEPVRPADGDSAPGGTGAAEHAAADDRKEHR